MSQVRIRLRGVLVAACIAGISLALSGCSLTKWITRTETDTYTITDRDTTVVESMRNVPGTTSDSSHVAVSSRNVEVFAHANSFDSVAKRDYPNFLRLGLIEVAALYSSGRSNSASGLLGAYAAADEDQSRYPLWRSELVRIAPVEVRLRWFNDAPNWTLGWSAFEHWAMGDTLSHSFVSIAGANYYVRRRFYLRDQIPYVIFNPYLGVSAFPSAYVNLGAEFHVGSLGGLNLRAYAGVISGFLWADPTWGGTYPYAGLGVSALDFTNRVEETEREWKYYTRSTIGATIVDGSTNFSTWVQGRFATVQFPLPMGNYHAWVGTSLVEYMDFITKSAGATTDAEGVGILPISVGYRQYLGSENYMVEPFLEGSYYPSSYFNLGARLKIIASSGLSFGGVAGYASGSPGNFAPQEQNFSNVYWGLSLSLGDWNYSPEKIRELRAIEIPSTMK
ncbi:MAG: hypothetical protein Q8921_13915 [Bacteroidota bacterium]|nr:hypothetical protein [Bacteroidota bacterium]